MVIRFANIDAPDDHIDVETFGHGIDQGDKSPGKAMSYAVKYALLKTLGLETGDDPDLDQDVRHAPASADQAYVARSLVNISAMSSKAALDDWWKHNAKFRTELGIVDGTPAYLKLLEACKAQSTKVAANGAYA
jgi:hypothetical protein